MIIEKMIKIFKIISLIFLLLMPVRLLAYSAPFQPMKVELSAAEKIILGRITAYSPVVGFPDGILTVCGWAIDVEVDHAFRGNDEKITIYTDEFDSFIGLDKRYFILVFKNYSYDKTGDSRYSKCKDEYWGMMGAPKDKGDLDISSFKYTTSGPVKDYTAGLYPIDPYLTKKVGGDWLIAHTALDSLSTHFVDTEENPDHPGPYLGVYLLDFLKENWDIISAPHVEQE